MVWMPLTRWMWILLGKSSVLLLLEVSLKGGALPPIRYSHAGICPNDMNPNLWVDAQSTCKRECEADLVSGCFSPAPRRHGWAAWLPSPVLWGTGGLMQAAHGLH